MTNALTILICGSQKFTDEQFVHDTLETFWEQTNGNIGNVITSKFSGACQFAEQWIKNKNESLSSDNKIKISFYLFDEHLNLKNNKLFEDLEIPKFVLENDDFYIAGKEKMQEANVNLVMAFPNKEGQLGTATTNIKRFAQLSGAKVLDCSQLLQYVTAHRQENNIVKPEGNQLGLTNHHAKKIKK